jgi:hypothetical protein
MGSLGVGGDESRAYSASGSAGLPAAYAAAFYSIRQRLSPRPPSPTAEQRAPEMSESTPRANRPTQANTRFRLRSLLPRIR